MPIPTPQKVKVNVERLFVLYFDVEQSEGEVHMYP